MPSAEREVTIPENDPQWRRGVVDIRRVSGEGAGAVYDQGVKGPMGRRIAADIEPTEVKPNDLIAFRTLKGPVCPVGRYELAPAADGTRVRLSLAAELSAMKSLLMSRAVQRSMDAEAGALDELKRVLESRG
jgi:hypothetical protein